MEQMENTTKETNKVIDLAIAQINKTYGAGSIVKLGDTEVQSIPVVSTGALSLDIALGAGGLPLGRIVEIYGPESSGKSTLACAVVGAVQAAGGVAAYIDSEHALDPVYARNVGVNVDDLYISQPDYGEQALEILDVLVRTGEFQVIVVDSVAALTPKAELEGDMEASHMGLQPRMMAKALRKITANANKNHTMVIFINQIREKIGIMFGNPETTPGGRALKFYASVRIDMRKKEDLKSKEGVFEGVKVKAKVVKNKVGPPFRVADIDIMYGRGVNQIGCLVDTAVDYGVLNLSGAWYKYNDEVFAQGRVNAIEKLASDLDLADEIKNKVLQKVGLSG